MDSSASDATVRLVWEGLLGTDRVHRYYGYLSHHLEQKHSRLTLLAALSSFAAFAGFLVKLPAPWDTRGPAILLLITAVLNAWVWTQKYPRGISDSIDLHRQLSRLLVEWEDLWADVYRADESQIRARWIDLKQRTNRVTEDAASRVPLIQSLADKSQNEAYSYRDPSYAST